MSENTQILIKKRTLLKGHLTRFKNFLDKVDQTNEVAVKELQIRLQKFESFLDEFNHIQDSIELSDISEVSDNDTERESFENNFYNLKSIACTIIDSFNKKNISDNVSVSGSGITDHSNNTNMNVPSNSNNNSNVPGIAMNDSVDTVNVRLPAISLPTFSGEDDQWLAFYDSFNSLIHENEKLPNIQKLHYLKSSLKGDAALVIQSIKVSSDNYKVAWELLKENFENKPSIIEYHVKSLFNQDVLCRESYTELKQLLNNSLRHVRALEMLKQPTGHWDLLLIHLISSKFDNHTKNEWEKTKSELDCLPNIEDLTSFLKKRCKYLKSTSNASSNAKRPPFVNRNEKATIKAHVSTKNQACKFCNENHPIFRCNSFLELNIKDRINEISNRKLCKNCLKPNHLTKECTSSNCRICNLKHNSLLHLSNEAKVSHNLDNAGTSSKEPESNSGKPDTAVGLSCSYSTRTQVLLPTALIHVLDKYGNKIKCRILLDSASQCNFITKELLNQLGVNAKRIDVPISGINKAQSQVLHETVVKIESLHNSFNSTISCLVLPHITQNLPHSTLNVENLNIPKNLVLADPYFNQSNEIQLLIGAELFWKIMCIGQISLGKSSPVAQKTQFGWVISGPLLMTKTQVHKHRAACVSCLLTTNHNDLYSEVKLQEQLTNFWKLEEINSRTIFTPEEIQCEEFFKKTTTHDENGKFVVRLPFKENIKELGESYDIAKRRFLALENRLESDQTIKDAYLKFMQEYIDLGHMSKVNYSIDELPSAYFLPHHAVFKTDSLTSKIRIVFDGSCKTTSGISLNDTLMVGPTVQSDLFSIILRFRLHKYAFTSDCEKMYRQVIVHESDRNKQSIIWRKNKSDPLNYYKLNTVTYGTSSAPFLATRCLLQIANENHDNFPEACKLIQNDFYIDDLISGSNTIENALILIQQVNTLLNSAGFPLRKWTSNCPEILKNLDRTTTIMHFNNANETVKTLGLVWDSGLDTFKFPVNICNQSQVTKRTILSTISRIFDPLGFIGPIVITAKIIIQRLWQLNMHWDESIPVDLYSTWVKLQDELIDLGEILVPRHALCSQPIKIQLHAFSDASETSYGACIYLRSTDSNNQHTVHLLCAKSRVAPLKSLTIPKLELCAAHLAAKLVCQIRDQLNCNIDEYYFWCDSTIVLAWLSKSPSQLKPFVAHRVADIVSSTDISHWHHIVSQQNPADIISRGMSPKLLANCTLWWHGPHWLCQDILNWPNSKINISEVNPPEIRRTKISFISTLNCNFMMELINKYSQLDKLQRVVSYCIRFAKNCSRIPNSRTHGPPTVAEIDNSMIYIVKAVQSIEFSDEINYLKNKRNLSKKSKLLALNPFLDKDEILRVGGRLKNSDLGYLQKHPCILPKKCHLTDLIIRYNHLNNLHASCQLVLSNIRNNGFWPLGGINTVKRVLNPCVTCRRVNLINYQPPMGDLPSSRVVPCKPFTVCGTDFAGPFSMKESKGRGRRIIKAYLCIFVCFTTKAVHLEVVGDLTTESFIACLRRFISRRGLCHTIHSDNGTNYVGTNSELKKWYDLASTSKHNDLVSDFLRNHHISWKFIPARTPHFGGLWEAVVKSVKRHLHTITRTQTLTYEEMSTLFAQIEAILNSRPLMPMSSEPSDYSFLCPAHFLIGDSLLTLPEPNLLDVKENYLSRFQLVQQLQQHFWKRWSKDYLNTLQSRAKWKQSANCTINPGTLVLLRDVTPPLAWRMGRIIDVHPGADGIVRVITVKTASSIVKRGVTQLCELLNDSTYHS